MSFTSFSFDISQKRLKNLWIQYTNQSNAMHGLALCAMSLRDVLGLLVCVGGGRLFMSAAFS